MYECALYVCVCLKMYANSITCTEHMQWCGNVNTHRYAFSAWISDYKDGDSQSYPVSQISHKYSLSLSYTKKTDKKNTQTHTHTAYREHLTYFYRFMLLYMLSFYFH